MYIVRVPFILSQNKFQHIFFCADSTLENDDDESQVHAELHARSKCREKKTRVKGWKVFQVKRDIAKQSH